MPPPPPRVVDGDPEPPLTRRDALRIGVILLVLAGTAVGLWLVTSTMLHPWRRAK